MILSQYTDRYAASYSVTPFVWYTDSIKYEHMFVKREMMDYIGKNSKVTAGVTDGGILLTK